MPFIKYSLVFLFNTSLETSQFPDPWKIARVSPIFKDGDKTEKFNYRSISVLPVISRLFEELVFNQLYQYLNDVSSVLTSLGLENFILLLQAHLKTLMTGTAGWIQGIWQVWSL